MDVAGWRLTPFSDVDPLTPHQLAPAAASSSLPSSSSTTNAYAERSITVGLSDRFYLNLTHAPFAPSSAGPTQFALELSAGGNRVARALLDVSDGRAVDVWLDGSSELCSVTVNSKAVGVVGSWEWIGYENEDDPLALSQHDRAEALSGALVLRVFAIASRKDGSQPHGVGHDDRDANQVLEDYLDAQAGGADQAKDRRVEVDLAVRPPYEHSTELTPDSSHDLQMLRSSLRSVKPAVATFVLGYQRIVDPSARLMASLLSADEAEQAPAIATANGHPTPPPSTRPKPVPSSGSATYARPKKKRVRASTDEGSTTSDDEGGRPSSSSTAASRGTFQPVTPLQRGAAKPGKDGKLPAPPAAPSSASPSKPSAAHAGSGRKSSATGESSAQAQPKRRKTVQTAPAPPSHPPAAKTKATSVPAPGPTATSSTAKDSPRSAPASQRARSGSRDPMQLGAAGDQTTDDEIQIVEPPAPASSRDDRRRASAREAQSEAAEAYQGLLDFGDVGLFEHSGDDSALSGGGGGSSHDHGSGGVIDLGDDDDFVPAPNNLFSSGDQRPAQSRAPAVAVSESADEMDVVEDRSDRGGRTDDDVDFSSFLNTHVGGAADGLAGASAQEGIAPDVPLVSPSAQVEDLLEVKDDHHASPGPSRAAAANGPAASHGPAKVKDDDDADTEGPSEHERELDESELTPLDKDIRDSVAALLTNAFAGGAKAFTHQYIAIDVDGLRKEKVDISPELESIRAKFAIACQPSIIRSALVFLPSLSTDPAADLSSSAEAALPAHLADLREALLRVVVNATTRQQTDMYNKLRAAWEPGWPGDVGTVVKGQKPGTEQLMRDKMAMFLRAELKRL